jgi:hypothetical protein
VIHLSHDSSDEPSFVELVERAMNETAAVTESELLHIVKIDSWFGERWYRFSGKILGAAGCWSGKLTVPPFHPHRVVSERLFRTGDSDELLPIDTPLHAARTSQSNLKNFVERLGRSIAIVWYSGNTQNTGQGSIMAYTSGIDGVTAWHVGLEQADGWQVAKLVGIDRREWAKLLQIRKPTDKLIC